MNSRDSAENKAGVDVEARLRFRKKWLILAAFWIQLIVTTFVVVRLSRLATPLGDWVKKIIDLTT